MVEFRLTTDFEARGDQPRAGEELVDGLEKGLEHQTLLGVTGSGKTFTMANVIARVNRPTLVIAPNKTLAAQLCSEFRELFPENAVEYFVSYYDYYQPEAYVPRIDLYIEKDASINERIDKMRHSATYSLFERNDVIIVASVSCIYGLGSPEAYHDMLLLLRQGQEIDRKAILSKLVQIHYRRNDIDFHRGTFRARGDVIDVFPVYEEARAVRIEMWGDEVTKLSLIDPLRGRDIETLEKAAIYPATHYVTDREKLERAIKEIEKEMEERVEWFRAEGKFVEAQRLEQRTKYDLEMMEQLGYCTGIENYSRHLDGRAEGKPPPTLVDFFPDDCLLFIDESHITVPQLGAMYRGDRSRKETLVEYGFRLPSALDNRPLKFEEFVERTGQVIYVSATPGGYELEKSKGAVVEQIIRPTGLIDPEVAVKPAKNQVDDLLEEIHARVGKGHRVLVTTLTKRMAEDLTEYYHELGLRTKYLHSDIDTIERVEILQALRRGDFDILIGINLLREGLDLPEVSLVAILDADKEGFLRSERSLIQTFGRAARNIDGRVVMYADRETESMRRAIDETNRRRKKQAAYNRKHNITPETVKKEIVSILSSIYEADYVTVPKVAEKEAAYRAARDMPKCIAKLRKEMKQAADNLEFELAAEIRDEIKALEEKELAYMGK